MVLLDAEGAPTMYICRGAGEGGAGARCSVLPVVDRYVERGMGVGWQNLMGRGVVLW